MPSPLLKNLERAIRQAKDMETLLSAVDELERASRGRGPMPTVVRDAKRYTRRRWVDPRRIVAGMTKRAVGELMDQIGPLGWVLKAMFRPSGNMIAREVEREISAVRPLMEALKGLPIGGGDRKAMNEQLADYLREQGFSVQPPQPTQPQSPRPQPQAEPPRRNPRTGTAPPSPMGSPLPSNMVEVQVGASHRRFRQDDPIITGQMIEVSSSNVHSIGFVFNWDNPAASTLKVRFLQKGKGGGKTAGPMYYYYDVHPDLFRAFQAAASKGKFVWDKLRIRGTVSGHQYRYSLRTVTGGYVPRRAVRRADGEYYQQRTVKTLNIRTGKIETLRSRSTAYVGPYRGEPNRGVPYRGRG